MANVTKPRQIWYGVAALLVSLYGCGAARAQQKKVKAMNNELAQALRTAADSRRDFSSRLAALDAVAGIRGPESINSLRKLLDRALPSPDTVSINFDPIALERVVNLHVIETLHVLGDDSEIARISKIVSQASGVLKGLEDESSNAAQVIAAIGRVETIRDLSQLAVSSDPKSLSNAVKVLDRLHLPQPSVCGPIPKVPALERPVEFQFQTLKQELETMEKLSEGHIRLSPGVKQFLVTGDYDRGGVRRTGSLAGILENYLKLLDFEYYTTGQTVVICTFQEAGERWRAWWVEHGRHLSFNNGSFVLAVR